MPRVVCRYIFLQRYILGITCAISCFGLIAFLHERIISIWECLVLTFIGRQVGTSAKIRVRLCCSEQFFPYKIRLEITVVTFQIPLVNAAKLRLKRSVCRHQVVYNILLRCNTQHGYPCEQFACGHFSLQSKFQSQFRIIGDVFCRHFIAVLVVDINKVCRLFILVLIGCGIGTQRA